MSIIAHLQDTIARLVQREIELKDALERANTRANLLSEALDAYRLKEFGAVGSGVDCSEVDLVTVCRKCGNFWSPGHGCVPI